MAKNASSNLITWGGIIVVGLFVVPRVLAQMSKNSLATRNASSPGAALNSQLTRGVNTAGYAGNTALANWLARLLGKGSQPSQAKPSAGGPGNFGAAPTARQINPAPSFRPSVDLRGNTTSDWLTDLWSAQNTPLPEAYPGLDELGAVSPELGGGGGLSALDFMNSYDTTSGEPILEWPGLSDLGAVSGETVDLGSLDFMSVDTTSGMPRLAGGGSVDYGSVDYGGGDYGGGDYGGGDYGGGDYGGGYGGGGGDWSDWGFYYSVA